MPSTNTSNLYSQRFKNPPQQKILNKFYKICEEKSRLLIKKINQNEIAAIDIIFEKNDLKTFAKIADKSAKFNNVLVLGVGGSSLSGKTLTSLKFQNRLYFLESIDPKTVTDSLREIDLKNTFFLVISKSGETIETICQTLIILDKLRQAKVNNLAKQFLFVTESTTNSIAKIAKEISAEIISHPNNIGGRFSCFSAVGMLPLAICGGNMEKVRNGAKKILGEFLDNKKNKIIESCALQLCLYEQGFTSNVVMPYIDNLKNFTDWYRQLWAESLGKNGFGATPINSMGTIDQHSQLQLYLEGPKDKFFTFFTQKNHPIDFLIKDVKACQTLFGGKKLSEIVDIEQTTTIEVLNQKKLPIRIFEIDFLNEEVIGGLMMQMFLEVMLIADVKNINPFGQPAVELRKDLAKSILAQLANHLADRI
jgi:glucose-6-phosphate isomerase